LTIIPAPGAQHWQRHVQRCAHGAQQFDFRRHGLSAMDDGRDHRAQQPLLFFHAQLIQFRERGIEPRRPVVSHAGRFVRFDAQ
jgi:hypothetical protein